MKLILKINGIIELLAGLALIFNPNWLLMQKNIDIATVSLAKLYGILAFFFGLVSYLLSNEFAFTQLFKRIILAVITFHMLVSLYLYGLYTQGVLTFIGAAAFHLIIAVSFLMMYYKDMTLFDKNN